MDEDVDYQDEETVREINDILAGGCADNLNLCVVSFFKFANVR